ncbi:hypothetical protein OAN22_01800, partial [Alphaproteobacteria bacterium]|nr:hypothetical protein [Alphaproteobacteria bacterium]
MVGRNKEVGDAFKKKRQPLAPPLQAEKKTDARERGTGGGKVPSNRFAAVLENPKDSVVIRKHRKENTDSENALKRRFSQLEKNEGLGLASGVGIGLDAAIFMILFNTPPSQLNVNHLFLAQAATFGVSTVVSLFFLKRDAEIAGFSCDVDASPGDPRVLPLADSRGTIHLLQMLQMIWTFS